MKNTIKDNLNSYVSLCEEEFEYFYSCLKPYHLAKGEHLLFEGEVCKNAYFIVAGCLKYFYLVDGEERIGQFFFEGAWTGDLYSFISLQPSKMNISAIEDSTLLALSYENLQRLYREVPKMERFGRLLIERVFISSQQRSASFLTKTPTEKYMHLVHTRPKVVNRVPQYMIAAYLGIKPESLSRIRKKMAKK